MKDIKGYEGLYAITNDGKVWSYRAKRFMKSNNSNNGYGKISLSINGEEKTHSVHRLVALNYIKNADSKPQVNHINGNKKDNSVNNLEWVSAKENICHAFREGLNVTKKGVDHHCHGKDGPWKEKYGKHPLSKKIIEIATGNVYDSVGIAARSLGLIASNICKVLKGSQKSYKGYEFKYLEEKLS